MDCTICLETIDQYQYALTCAHVFHKECITLWLKENNTCPLCRTQIEINSNYVDDGVINEEQLKILKDTIKLSFHLIEQKYPNKMKDFSYIIDRLIDNEDSLEKISISVLIGVGMTIFKNHFGNN